MLNKSGQKTYDTTSLEVIKWQKKNLYQTFSRQKETVIYPPLHES